MDHQSAARSALNPWRLTGAFFLCAFILVFGAFTVGRKVNVDENVFIASAALLSRHFILPYGAYHYNHMPTLLIVYAILFKTNGYLLLTARTFCAICAAGAAALFCHVAYDKFARLDHRRRLFFALGIGLLFLFNPLFTHTAGRAWNHDFPVFMSLLAFVTIGKGLAKDHIPMLALSGFLVGLAVTARLTFATEMLPFVLFVLLYAKLPTPRRLALLAAFCAGGLVACIPSIWVWAQSPLNAYFGNFQYPAFNSQWHFLNDDIIHERYTFLAKLWLFIKKSWELPGNGIVLVGFLTLITIAVRRHRALRSDWGLELLILILLVASQLAAGLVPSPPFEQYFYALTPFMFLAIILCLSRIPNLTENTKLNWLWITCFIVTFGFALPEYRDFPSLFWIPSWAPVRVHELGQQIARQAKTGPVLTLDPIYVLEGGLDIYPALATGPFGMRVGDYLTPAQRAQYKMWGSDDLRQLFATHPPPAVMISPGSDNRIENLFVDLATADGYHEVDVNLQKPGVIILWLPREAEKVYASAR